MSVITLADNAQSIAMKMSEGNPGGLRVCMEMLSEPFGFISLCHADDRNIRGSDLWVLYKDICESDIDKVCQILADRDNNIEKKIKEFS